MDEWREIVWDEMPVAGTIIEVKWPGFKDPKELYSWRESTAKVVVGDKKNEFHNLAHLGGYPSKRSGLTVLVFGPSFWRPIE